MTARRVAAIDCGTNSIRLLVADVDLDVGSLVDVHRQMEIVRLGAGVDQTGRLSAQGLERTFAACDLYAGTIEALGVERLRFVATSATRDASNRGAFVQGVQERLGVEPDVVSGAEEARLSFAGSAGELVGLEPAPFLVVDIGGGSTEFVLGSGQPEAAWSVDMGCVRLTERHLRSDPPTAAQVAAARMDVEALIDEAAARVPLERSRTLVGLAGSVTTVAAIAIGLPRYDAEVIHHSRIGRATVHEVTERLLAMSREQRAALPVLHPGRVDVIGGGALVLDAVLDRLASVGGIDEVVVSEHDILDGIAWSAAALP